MLYADFAAGAALLARCLCPRSSYGHVLAISTKAGRYYCQRLPRGDNRITYTPLNGASVVLCTGRNAWQQPWPAPEGITEVVPGEYNLFYKPPQAAPYSEEELTEAGSDGHKPNKVAQPAHLKRRVIVTGPTDHDWLAAILSGVCAHHKVKHIECEFTYNQYARHLVWTVGTVEALAAVAYDGTNQPRISVAGSIKADLQRYLGRSWRFGGIRVSPMFPIIRPKPYAGWGG